MLLGGATLSVRSNQDSLPSSALSSKYGHFCLQRIQDGGSCNAKLKASKVHKLVGDVTMVLHSGQKL